MDADPFSDILSLTNAEAIVTGGFSAGGPWAIQFPGRDRVKFFAVLKGACWVHLEGVAEPFRFETGDIGLLATRRAFVLASAPGIAPVDAMDLFSNSQRTAVLGDGADFTHIGGHVLLDPIRGRLLADILPPWIHIHSASPQAARFRWLLDQLVEERALRQPGANLASAQLTQLLFIQILRAHLTTADLIPPGWLKALADPRVAPALRLMHADPARNWHLEELAKACAMSRTTFALHFRTLSGMAPLTYLGEWRMRLAERALRDLSVPVSSIALSLGYTSESAFSHAFKRFSGQSPRTYRTTAPDHAAASASAERP